MVASFNVKTKNKMSDYRYKLEKYNGRDSRYTCPKCGKANTFTRYIDMATGNAVARNVGKCNRIDKCAYHYTPKQYIDEHDIGQNSIQIHKPKPQLKALPVSYIDSSILENSISYYDYKPNNLIKFLDSAFGKDIVNHLINMYKIGTSSLYSGGTTIFWQIDINDNIRTGKLIKYDNEGHRIKGCNNWIHAVKKLNNFNLNQCFFGEHLLKYMPDCKVGIVESEKTAIMLAAFLPEMVWLASGGAEGINDDKVKALKGREVTLFPDASNNGAIYQKWRKKAKRYGFEISDYLEKNTTQEQKAQGVDIADFFKSDNDSTNKKDTFSSTTDFSHQLTKDDNDTESFANSDHKQVNNLNKIPLAEHLQDISQIPYSSPSPVAIIDSEIENPPKFEKMGLILENRIFKDEEGNEIVCVGTRSYGFCEDWKKHNDAKGYCRACLLNTMHVIMINGIVQTREFTQLEILIMANDGQKTIKN